MSLALCLCCSVLPHPCLLSLPPAGQACSQPGTPAPRPAFLSLSHHSLSTMSVLFSLPASFLFALCSAVLAWPLRPRACMLRLCAYLLPLQSVLQLTLCCCRWSWNLCHPRFLQRLPTAAGADSINPLVCHSWLPVLALLDFPTHFPLQMPLHAGQTSLFTLPSSPAPRPTQVPSPTPFYQTPSLQAQVSLARSALTTSHSCWDSGCVLFLGEDRVWCLRLVFLFIPFIFSPVLKMPSALRKIQMK